MDLDLRIIFKGQKSFYSVGKEFINKNTIPMKRKSPFQYAFKMGLLKLHETGRINTIHERVGSYKLPKETIQETSWSGLTYESIFTCFLGYGMTMIVGFGILMFEIFRQKKMKIDTKEIISRPQPYSKKLRKSMSSNF